MEGWITTILSLCRPLGVMVSRAGEIHRARTPGAKGSYAGHSRSLTSEALTAELRRFGEDVEVGQA